jgi:acid phosphatase
MWRTTIFWILTALIVLGVGARVERAECQGVIPRPAHVVIVIEENHAYSEIIGNPEAPYINSLARQGASFPRSFAIGHPSEPNYLALFSGSSQGVRDDACDYTFSTPNLGHDLIAAGFSFTGYSEDLHAVWFTGCTSAKYARKHNPWVNWQSDISPSPNALPPSVNQPFTSFPSDFANLGTLSIVVPNQDDDMHDGTIAQADAWLQQHLDPYVQWAMANDSLLIVTWDESDLPGNRIPTIFVGPMVKPGRYPQSIDHYSVLRTLEDMYGLRAIGQAAAAVPITSVWINP